MVSSHKGKRVALQLDQDVCARIIARDQQTWSEITETLEPCLKRDVRISLRKATRGIKSWTDHDERQVVEEIALQVFGDLPEILSRMKQYIDPEKTYHFIRKAAMNYLRRHLKAIADRIRREVSLEEDSDDDSDTISMDRFRLTQAVYSDSKVIESPEITVQRELDLDYIAELLRKLRVNETHQQIFLRHHLLEETVDSLADAYHLSEQSIRQILRRVRTTLRSRN